MIVRVPVIPWVVQDMKEIQVLASEQDVGTESEAMWGLQKEICVQMPRAELLKMCTVDHLQHSHPGTFVKNANRLGPHQT